MNHGNRNYAHSRVKKKKGKRREKKADKREYRNKILAEIENLGSKRSMLAVTAKGSKECGSL